MASPYRWGHCPCQANLCARLLPPGKRGHWIHIHAVSLQCLLASAVYCLFQPLEVKKKGVLGYNMCHNLGTWLLPGPQSTVKHQAYPWLFIFILWKYKTSSGGGVTPRISTKPGWKTLAREIPKYSPNFWSLNYYLLNAPGLHLHTRELLRERERKEGRERKRLWSHTAQGGPRERGHVGWGLCLTGSFWELPAIGRHHGAVPGVHCIFPRGRCTLLFQGPRQVCRGSNRSFCLLGETPSIQGICGELAYRFFHFACHQQRTVTHTQGHFLPATPWVVLRPPPWLLWLCLPHPA